MAPHVMEKSAGKVIPGGVLSNVLSGVRAKPKPPPLARRLCRGATLSPQKKSLEAYWKIFGGATDYSVIARNTIDQLASRLGHH